jgi:Lipase (class 3)
MTTIDRRAMLRAMLGAGVMPVGLASLISDPVKSAPLTFGAGFNLAEASDLLYMCDQLYGRPSDSKQPSVPMPNDFNWVPIFTSPDLPPLGEKWQLWQNNAIYSTYAIIVRGTGKSFGSVLEDFISFLAPATGAVTVAGVTIPYKFAADAKASVHVGFALGTLLLLKFPIVGILAKLAAKVPPGSNVYIAGHSQGAGVAPLLRSYLYYGADRPTNNYFYKTYSFAQPKPGNDHYATDFENLFCNTGLAFRLTNSLDPVPELPFTIEIPSDVNNFPLNQADAGSSILTTLNTLQSQAGKAIVAKVTADLQGTALALARTANPTVADVPFTIPIVRSLYFVGAATEIAVIGTPCIPNQCNPQNPKDRVWQHHAATYYSLMQAQLDN